jgi:hypothetical protein
MRLWPRKSRPGDRPDDSPDWDPKAPIDGEGIGLDLGGDADPEKVQIYEDELDPSWRDGADSSDDDD